MKGGLLEGTGWLVGIYTPLGRWLAGGGGDFVGVRAQAASDSAGDAGAVHLPQDRQHAAEGRECAPHRGRVGLRRMPRRAVAHAGRTHCGSVRTCPVQVQHAHARAHVHTRAYTPCPALRALPLTSAEICLPASYGCVWPQIVGTLKGFRNNKPLPLGVIVQNVGGQRNFKMAIIEQILIETVPQVRCGFCVCCSWRHAYT